MPRSDPAALCGGGNYRPGFVKHTGQPVAASFVANFLKPEMHHVYRQVCALQAFRPSVFTFRRENADRFPFSESDLHVVRRSSGRWWRKLWRRQLLGLPLEITSGECRRLEKGLAESRARLLHVYFGHIGALFLPWLRRATLPSVLSFHGADVSVGFARERDRTALREALGLATLVLARSEALGDDLRALGCNPDKIRIHRAGLPAARFSATPHTHPGDGEVVVIQACRFIAKKGLPTTLAAFARFSAGRPASRLVLVGSGPMRAELERRAQELGIAGKVEFAGFLDEAALVERYGQAHLFVHPSETGPEGDREGVPNTVIEAMAAGLPVIGSRHGGIPEAIEDGVSGLLVPEADAEALAVAMSRALGDKVLYDRLASAASARAKSLFDLEANTRLLEGWYSEAIELAGDSIKQEKGS